MNWRDNIARRKTKWHPRIGYWNLSGSYFSSGKLFRKSTSDSSSAVLKFKHVIRIYVLILNMRLVSSHDVRKRERIKISQSYMLDGICQSLPFLVWKVIENAKRQETIRPSPPVTQTLQLLLLFSIENLFVCNITSTSPNLNLLQLMQLWPIQKFKAMSRLVSSSSSPTYKWW